MQVWQHARPVQDVLGLHRTAVAGPKAGRQTLWLVHLHRNSRRRPGTQNSLLQGTASSRNNQANGQHGYYGASRPVVTNVVSGKMACFKSHCDFSALTSGPRIAGDHSRFGFVQLRASWHDLRPCGKTPYRIFKNGTWNEVFIFQHQRDPLQSSGIATACPNLLWMKCGVVSFYSVSEQQQLPTGCSFCEFFDRCC